MQSFIVGLLLACVSGVTVVAFKHPVGFARLFPYVLAAMTALFIGFNIWHVAIEVAWTNALGYVSQEALPEATGLKQRLRPPYAWVALCYIGVVAFLWINLKLPPFLRVSDENGAQGDENESH